MPDSTETFVASKVRGASKAIKSSGAGQVKTNCVRFRCSLFRNLTISPFGHIIVVYFDQQACIRLSKYTTYHFGHLSKSQKEHKLRMFDKFEKDAF